MNYLIELDRWGIKKGLPAKPYVDEDYFQADANIQGINNAIQYAKDEGFNEVTLPQGEYAICYPRPIQMLDSIQLNLHFCKLKVIYDSDRKSPFDTRTGTDYYNFKGISVSFAKTEHAKLVGGEIEGCRVDRSFSNPTEVAFEHSYGVVFKESAVFNQLEHCKVHDFMGDNISFQSSGFFPYVEFDEGCTVESLDYKTGLPIPVTTPKTLITKALPIQFDGQKPTEFMFVGGTGYARLTSLTNKFFDVFFYDKDGKFLGAHKKRRIYSDIEVPPVATKYRFQYLDESVPRQHALTVWFGRIPSHNVISQCEIYGGHRGGVTLGGSHNTLYKNVIRSNGKGLANFLDGKPMFNDPTRYGVNMEDSYGASCIIDDNEIYDCFHGILVGCYDVEITRNKIHDTDFNAINLYACSHVKIKDNYLWNNMNNVGLQAPQFYFPYVEIHDNTFDGGKLNFPTTANYRVDIKNNQFINPESVILNDNCTMSDCHFVYNTTVNATAVIANKLKDCSFNSSQQIILRELIIKSPEIENCTFENLRVRFESQNNKVSSNVKITTPKFKACEIRNHNFGAPVYVDVLDGKLIDTIAEVGITNVDGINPYTRLYNCQINIASTGIKYLFISDNTRQYTTHIAENCKINISHTNFDAILNGGFAAQSNELILKNNDITYVGTTPLNLKYYKTAAHIKNFVSDGNTFTNINLPV
ncbi:right-handed parallel beta-helix repeat-containing protein [Bacillus pseudomycoides]|uniref:right-handed parallel beta-helix repeat-containing protein n=1 Tax=Bacillus pseudomycoides TaxID=64104 RepID=UPI002FFDB145